MRKVKFITGGYYHIYNRGTEKRDIFCDNSDYLRFIYSIHKLNSIKPAFNLQRSLLSEDFLHVRGRASNMESRLISMLYYVIIPNHFHFVLQQTAENGVEKFMQRLGTSYAMYFNKRYDRSGILFQSRFKGITIETESYIKEVSRYIHLNPLKLIDPKFKKSGIKDLELARRFLNNYKWSSYLDYIGRKNFPALISNDLHNAYFINPAEYEKFVFN